MAHQIWVFTAFSLVPANFLIRRCLLDPLEELFDLPAVLVKLRNHRRWQCRVVGQKDQRLARWVLETNPAHMLRVIFGRLESIERTDWSHTTPVALSTLAEYTRRALKLDFARVTKKAPA